ncbi:MAG: hypothetical protein J6R99_01650 [Alphaproteobacteria bacterium]|nr:hypothetical protein [Alphaproteobacteria bacterium]
MWRLFFETCDYLVGLIPSRKLREKIRHDKLYDYRKKFNALRAAIKPDEFKKIQVIKGGWNIGFIVNKKYVCKIRKFFDSSAPIEKIMREKRITDAFAKIVPLKIPQIELIESGGYTFYKYNFIPGTNLNRFSLRTMKKHHIRWGKQLADFIYKMHNADPEQIKDLKTADGDGWNHNDICNNLIIDKKTMKIIGLIDWEYSGWGMLETEIVNCTRFSKKMPKTGFDEVIRTEYKKLTQKA